MFDKLLATLKSSRAIATTAIATTILMANSVPTNSKEYVFSAPSEVDYNSVEIPRSETEYPLYECEDSEKNEQEKIDSHECDCVDCESFNQDSETDEELTSKNQQNK